MDYIGSRSFFKRHGLRGFSFKKTGAEIVTQATRVREDLVVKIQEREAYLKQRTVELGLTIQDVIVNLDQFDDNAFNSVQIGSTTLQGKDKDVLVNESKRLSEEKSELDRINMLIAHLDRNEKFTLSFDELDYFGF